MQPPFCIDPDQFLDLSGAVPVGKEDVRAAWDRAYALVESCLVELGPTCNFYIVFGLQGAGKSTWVARQSKRLPPNAVYLSGPLPSRKHRERALAIAKRVGCHTVAVWINEPFEIAFERNSRRTGLARIKEEAMRHVHESLEPPTLEEGFHQVIEFCASRSEA
jgi:hypothetical protein